MDEKEIKGLVEYLKTAISLERQMLEQQLLIDNFSATQKKKEPQLQQKRIPDAPAMEEMELGATIGLIIFALLFGIAGLAALGTDGIGAIIAGVCGFIAFLFCLPFIMQNKRNNERDEQYKQDVERIHNWNDVLKSKYDSDHASWNNSYSSSLEYLTEQKAKTEQILEKLYNKELIYPKYCNLSALTSICEYFITGRCNELSGPYGAYNLYEDELRKDIIISKLDDILNDLDAIRNNQYMLYQELNLVNQNIALANHRLSQIGTYTYCIAEMSELTAYYAGVNAFNTGVCATYSLQ